MAELVRTFISIKIPMTPEIESVLGDIKGVRNVRASSVSQIHITLCFLGDTDAKKIPELCSRLKTALSETRSFDLEMKGIGTFPNERNPRVIWLGFSEEKELCDIADIVRNVLDGMKLDYDGKRFSPHVTVGRVSGKADIAPLLDKYRDIEFCRFRCDGIKVMKSVLGPNGAKHSVLDSVTFL